MRDLERALQWGFGLALGAIVAVGVVMGLARLVDLAGLL
jgi:hypothetical protein